jgi:hypothetical protein
VNGQAKSEGLRDWLRKNSHGKLATAEENQPEEGKHVVLELAEQAKRNF